jgi:lipopolysaccharide export system permease protein
MLFHSTVRKELARSFGATLVVLVTIVMTMTLIRTLSQASRGSVNPEEVMMVMGYTVLGYLPTILTLSLFIAIVGTLSRMYRDSEMVIWFGAGRGLSPAAAAVRLRLADPAGRRAAGAGDLALGQPADAEHEGPLRQPRRPGAGRARPVPGVGQRPRVFFLDKDTPDNKSGKNIFISSTENGKRPSPPRAAAAGRDRWATPVPAAVQRPAAGETLIGRRLKHQRVRGARQPVGARACRWTTRRPRRVHPATCCATRPA